MDEATRIKDEFGARVERECLLDCKRAWRCASAYEKVLVSLEGWPVGRTTGVSQAIFRRMSEIKEYLAHNMYKVSSARQDILRGVSNRARSLGWPQ